ncbi:MAG: DoxX family protein [Bacteroidetes bacterium]|nr:DoxX family protein [Bacteroidota bacterium]
MLFNSTKYNKNLLDLGILFLRLVSAISMLSHGYPKLQMLLSGKIEFMSLWGLTPMFTLALVVFAEFLCSFFVILGLFTRLASLPIIFTMMYAIFGIHFHDEFSKMELPIFYLMSFIMILIHGAGKYSIDAMIEQRRNEWS